MITPRKKLLIVCEFFPPHLGGGETLLHLHGLNLSHSGKFEVRVVTATQPAAPAHESISPHFEVYRYAWRVVFGHPVARPSDIEKHAPWADIVHTVTYSCAIQSLIIARKYHKPIGISFFEVLGSQWIRIASNPLVGLGFYLFETVLTTLPFAFFHAISFHTQEKLMRRIPQQKIRMIYPFVPNLTPQKRATSCNNFFLFFGRAGKTKGLPVLIESIRLLSTRGIRPLFVLIIADYPATDRSVALQIISRHQLHNVLVLTQQPKLRLIAYIQCAKAVIVPSLTEGFGYAAYEASALGTPVIYSSNTALHEVVSVGVEFMNGDAPALSRSIAEFDVNKSTTSHQTHINNSNSLRQWEKLYSKLSAFE